MSGGFAAQANTGRRVSAMQRRSAVILSVVLATLVIPALPASAAENTYIVNRAHSDSSEACRAGTGACTLRGAIVAANTHAGRDRIVFAIPASEFDSSGKVFLDYIPPESCHCDQDLFASALPPVVDPVVIDGTTQPGYNGYPIVWLRGSRYISVDPVDPSYCYCTRITAFGLKIQGEGSLIKGLGVLGFGVQISLRGNGNIVQNMYVSTLGRYGHSAGTLDGSYGISVYRACCNTIGGSGSTGNVISENLQAGISVEGTSDTRIEGNLIGTDTAGTRALPNRYGVLVGGDSYPTMLNGLRTRVHDNVISGNEIGVLFKSSRFSNGRIMTATDNVVTGNTIGLNASATGPLPNLTGIEMRLDSSSTADNVETRNIIGGTQFANRNLIAGNRGFGVHIRSGPTGNRVTGNVIGLDALERAVSQVQQAGVVVESSNNSIGTAVFGAGNVISGNRVGLSLASGSSDNTVEGNLIGTSRNGRTARPNLGNGVEDRGTRNSIGGTSSGSRNVISGNAVSGVDLQGESAIVEGNYIGVDTTGAVALPNRAAGVYVGRGSLSTPRHTIGGVLRQSMNVISGNGHDGIKIEGVSGIRIFGNRIGTNADGTARIPNASGGVRITDSNDNLIGGVLPKTSLGNVLSGNNGPGLAILGSSRGNRVEGNRIGTNADGTGGLRNYEGVLVTGTNNIIGGTTAGQRNLISGNLYSGVRLSGGGFNQVLGNRIGTDPTGRTGIPANNWGVTVENSADNRIGGTQAGAGNLISWSTAAGVRLIGAATRRTVVAGNLIGTTADGSGPLPNGEGVFIDGANDTFLGSRNVIAFNAGPGVLILSGVGNQIFVNSIHDNRTLGIDLGYRGVNTNDRLDGDDGPNRLQNFPRLVRTGTNQNGQFFVTGRLESTSNSSFEIHIYSSASCDQSGNGEGRTFLQSLHVTVELDGTVFFSTALPPVAQGEVLTATATDNGGNTSEFGPCLVVT